MAIQGREEKSIAIHRPIPPEHGVGKPGLPVVEAADATVQPGYHAVYASKSGVQGRSFRFGHLIQGRRDVPRVLGQDHCINPGRIEDLNFFGRRGIFRTETPRRWPWCNAIRHILQDIAAFFGLQDVGSTHRRGDCREGQDHRIARTADRRSLQQLRRGAVLDLVLIAKNMDRFTLRSDHFGGIEDRIREANRHTRGH